MSKSAKPENIPLALPAAGYYAVQKLREIAYLRGTLKSEKAPIPVVSVGNIAMGGSGKTPFVIYLAELLRSRGLKPAIVSRGYGGSNRAPYLVVNDGTSPEALVAPSVCGDEPALIARRVSGIPVLTGGRRIHPVSAGARLFGARIAILDDGFQHMNLSRDADLVLLNGREDMMFPLGCLREPFSALARSGMIVLTGECSSVPPRAKRHIENTPVFRARTVPRRIGDDRTSSAPEALSGVETLLLSGIANPERFRRTAESLGWKIVDHRTYRDHHTFSERELRGATALASGVPIVVTEKDWVRLPDWFKNSGKVMFLSVETRVDDEEAFLGVLEPLISAADG